MPEGLPVILVTNRQRRIRIERDDLQRFAQRALERVVTVPGTDLPGEIGVVLVSDRRISELHRDFMRLSTPTDVITFQHGEIVISVDTAERQAAEHGTSLAGELKLYLLHGLLHLRGYDDGAPDTRRTMLAVQTRLFARLTRKNDVKACSAHRILRIIEGSATDAGWMIVSAKPRCAPAPADGRTPARQARDAGSDSPGCLC